MDLVTINPWYLISAGLIAITAELFFITELFFILWFGAAAILVGAIGLYMPLNGNIQVFSIGALGLGSFLLFRRKLMRALNASSAKNAASTSKDGIIVLTAQGLKVEYQGTQWLLAAPIPADLSDKEAVIVTSVDANRASIKRLSDETPSDTL